MFQNYFRLDLDELADILEYPVEAVRKKYGFEALPRKTLLDLVEVMLDFDFNRRLSWSGHSYRYRQDDFNRLLSTGFYGNDDAFCDFDNIMTYVADFMDDTFKRCLGTKLTHTDKIFELRRHNGWIGIHDIGKAPAPKKHSDEPTASDAQERRDIWASKMRRNRHIQPEWEACSPTIVPMRSFAFKTPKPDPYVCHRDEELTDEQFEWLAEVENLRAEYRRKHPTPPRTGYDLACGESFQRKRRILRAKLGSHVTKESDLLLDLHRDGFKDLSAYIVDDCEVRNQTQHRASIIRPVRVQSRRSRANTAQRRKATA